MDTIQFIKSGVLETPAFNKYQIKVPEWVNESDLPDFGNIKTEIWFKVGESRTEAALIMSKSTYADSDWPAFIPAIIGKWQITEAGWMCHFSADWDTQSRVTFAIQKWIDDNYPNPNSESEEMED